MRRQTLFLPDGRFAVDLTRTPCIDSRFVLLGTDPLITQYLETYTQQQAIRRELAELNWRLGFRGEAFFAIAQGVSAPKIELPVAGIERKTIARYEEVRKQMHDIDGLAGQRIEALIKVYP